MRIERSTRCGRVPLALVTAAMLAAATSSVAHAAFPGENGKIVFQTNRDVNNAEIYTMNADGTDRVALSRNPAEDMEPRWSPDGLRIAFVSDRTGNDEIFTMNADGSGVMQLTFTSAGNRRPSWTADGRILFQSDRDGNSEIYRMNADGSEQQNLTRNPADDLFAAASPSGNRTVFTSNRGGDYNLYVVNGAGSGSVRQITSTPGMSDFQANWSPRGNDLLFARADGSGIELFTVHANGTGLTRLTDTPGRVEFEPAWSPDGKKIVFHACDDPGTDDEYCANYVMNADGTGETDVSLRPQAPFVDTFTGELIDPFWNLDYRVGSGLSFTQANGRLEITVPADTALDPSDGFAATGLMSNCQLTGNWDMQVDCASSSPGPPTMVSSRASRPATSSTASGCPETASSSSTRERPPASPRTFRRGQTFSSRTSPPPADCDCRATARPSRPTTSRMARRCRCSRARIRPTLRMRCSTSSPTWHRGLVRRSRSLSTTFRSTPDR